MNKQVTVSEAWHKALWRTHELVHFGNKPIVDIRSDFLNDGYVLVFKGGGWAAVSGSALLTIKGELGATKEE